MMNPGHIAAFNRFKQNKAALFGSFVILLALFVSVFGAFVRPDSSRYANQMNLELGTRPPGFSVKRLLISKNKPEESHSLLDRFSSSSYAENYEYVPINDYRFEGADLIYSGYNESLKNKMLVEKINLADIVYPLSNKEKISKDAKGNLRFTTLDGKNHSESILSLQKKVEEEFIQKKTYYLGTDRFGRDYLSRVMAGCYASLSVGLVAVLITLMVGTSLGALAGYFGGKIDQLILWLIQVIWSIPSLLLVIVFTLALGKGFWQVFIAIGLSMWVDVARMVRSEVIRLRENQFIEVGKALGFTDIRILLKHIIPQTMGPLLILSTANFANAILLEAGLSFLGIGIQPPIPSWGSMIREHYAYVLVDASYLVLIPGFAIVLLVFAFMMLTTGLRKAIQANSVIPGYL